MVMATSIQAVLIEPKVLAYSGRRGTFLRPGEGETAECPCGKTVSFNETKETTDRLLVVFCSEKCRIEHISSYLVVPHVEPSKAVEKSRRPKFCPECEGPSTRGGFAHKDDDCPLKGNNAAKARAAKLREEKPNCPDCDGPPGRARGWKHKDDCARLAKVKARQDRPNCPDCDGPPGMVNGWKHKEGCAKVAKRVAQPAEPCSECGGPRKRGKGYTHVEGCSLKPQPQQHVNGGKKKRRGRSIKMPAGAE